MTQVVINPIGYVDGFATEFVSFNGFRIGKSQTNVPDQFVVVDSSSAAYINWYFSGSINTTPAGARADMIVETIFTMGSSNSFGIIYNSASDASTRNEFIIFSDGHWEHNYHNGAVSSGTGLTVPASTPLTVKVDASDVTGVPKLYFQGTLLAGPSGSGAPVTLSGTNIQGGLYSGVFIGALNSFGAFLVGVSSGGPTAPGAPTSVVATAGTASASLVWTAPVSDGGSAITDYLVEYSSNAGSSWSTFSHSASTTAAITATGLTPGASYIFRISAINAIGTSTASANSNSVIVFTVPGAPTAVIATAGTGSIGVSWTAPASNGGSAITDYIVEYAPSPFSSWTVFTDGTSTGTSTTITGLSAGVTYQARVSAVNAIGTGASATSGSATVNNIPDTPTAPVATKYGERASVSWAIPYNGGSAITGYTLQASANSGAYTTVYTGNTTTQVITGLTAGVSYTFKVLATNDIGSSAYSPGSNAAVPYKLGTVEIMTNGQELKMTNGKAKFL